MKIELSAQEAQSLTTLIDVAVRAQGLGVAMACVVFAERIKKAVEDEAAENAESKPKLAAVE